MAINLFKWIVSKNGKTTSQPVTIEELMGTAGELQIRLLCWEICENMIANAVGRCEFREYRENKEYFDREYYLWNFEPNMNENSTEFIHKIISKLYKHNEVLLIDGKKMKNGSTSLLVADTWDTDGVFANVQTVYKDVMVGDTIFKKQFREEDVIHLTLNHKPLKPVLDAITKIYGELAYGAQKYLEWTQSHHWKVHVNQMASGTDNFVENFQQMISEQLKPFLTNNAGVLPEFDGYTYTDVRADRIYQSANGETATLKNLAEEIFNFTARGFMIPVVLVNGEVEKTTDANKRFLTNVIDPICDQLQEEITRKRYGYDNWRAGNYMRVDSSSIIHFDLFEAASGIEKLVGSGAFTINDVRKAAGQAAIDESWADTPFMTKNITTLKGVETSTREGGEANA